MQKTDNIYIDALKYGVANMATGITLAELTNHLTGLGWTIDTNFQSYFHYWFFTHFYYDSAYTTFKNGNQTQVQMGLQNAATWSNIKCPMTSEAFEAYQDFEKLKQAKIDTKKAQRLANIAIWISGGLAFVQIVLQTISMFMDNNRFCFWCAF